MSDVFSKIKRAGKPRSGAAVLLMAAWLMFPISLHAYDEGSCAVFPAKSWRSTTPAKAGLDRKKIKALINFVQGSGAVYYQGQRVIAWGNPSARFDVASAAKPIFSLILFETIARGMLPGVEAKVSDYMGSCAAGIEFKHLANMVSEYTLKGAPGSQWAYNDYGINLYTKALFREVWGSDPQRVFDKVFKPLRFHDEPSLSSGAHYGALSISADDFARIGLLVMCKGRWGATQVIPARYFNNIRNRVSNNLPNSQHKCGRDPCGTGTFGGTCHADREGPDGRGIYGYNFWVYNEEHRNGPAIPRDTIILQGHRGKEAMIVIPSRDIIAVGHSPGARWGDPRRNSLNGFRKAVRLLTAAVPRH